MNLFDAGMPTPEEIVNVLYEKNGTRIERITSWHHATPEDFWYDQDEDEWLVLLEGEATLRYDSAQVDENEVLRPLKKGEPLLIPAHVRHQIAHTANPAIWLCVFITPTHR